MSHDLLRAARAALRHLPKEHRSALRKAIRREEAHQEGKGLCEGCEKAIQDRHLRYWWQFHDPRAMGLYCPPCRRLLNQDKSPPAREAALR